MIYKQKTEIALKVDENMLIDILMQDLKTTNLNETTRRLLNEVLLDWAKLKGEKL